MNFFLTGASGYIGGSIAAEFIKKGHNVTGLVSSKEKAEKVRTVGITPVMGNLDDLDVLTKAAQDADAVVNAANAEDRASAETLVAALAGSRKH